MSDPSNEEQSPQSAPAAPETSSDPRTPAPPAAAAQQHASVHSWAFWRKRLGRAAVVLGLGLLLTQVLPSVPQDNTVLYLAPSGYQIVSLGVVYLDSESHEPLAGTQLHPLEAADSTAHSLRLPQDTYELQLSIEFKDRNDIVHLSQQARSITLGGGATRVTLREP